MLWLYAANEVVYIALAAVVKFRIGGLKWLGTNKFVRTKSHTGSKFFKISLRLLCTQETVVVDLYCGFSLRSHMAPQLNVKFRTAWGSHTCHHGQNVSIVAHYHRIYDHYN